MASFFYACKFQTDYRKLNTNYKKTINCQLDLGVLRAIHYKFLPKTKGILALWELPLVASSLLYS